MYRSISQSLYQVLEMKKLRHDQWLYPTSVYAPWNSTLCSQANVTLNAASTASTCDRRSLSSSDTPECCQYLSYSHWYMYLMIEDSVYSHVLVRDVDRRDVRWLCISWLMAEAGVSSKDFGWNPVDTDVAKSRALKKQSAGGRFSDRQLVQTRVDCECGLDSWNRWNR